MAAHHPAGTAQLGAVVGADGILQLGIEAVDAQAITTVLAAGAVQVAATTQVQAHMRAALRPAKEDQIAGAQQGVLAGAHRHRLAEALLLVGVAGDPDTGSGEGGLGEAGAVVIGAEAAAPQVAVGPLTGRFSEGQHGRDRRGDGGGIEQPRQRRGAGEGMAEQGRLATYSAPVDPYLEVAGLMKKLDGGPAILFSNVKGFDTPVVGNMLSCRENVEAAFGVDFRSIRTFIGRALGDPKPPVVVTRAAAPEAEAQLKALRDVLARIHNVDYRAVGLGDGVGVHVTAYVGAVGGAGVTVMP